MQSVVYFSALAGLKVRTHGLIQMQYSITMFKPRIFISSTFSGNEEARNKIAEFFKSIGGEPLLYETNLTPSIQPLTYRQDILDADFVLLIMKENYGTPTDSGMSGTHEEYKLARRNNIPTHVYIQKGLNEENKLIEEIKNDNTSYFYFETDNKLLDRIKETTFTIAKEVMINQLSNYKLDESIVRNLSYNFDYQKGLEVIKIVETMKKFNKLFNYYDTNIFIAFLEPIINAFENEKSYFISKDLNEVMEEMLETANSFIDNYCLDYTANSEPRFYKTEILGKVGITQSARSEKMNLSQGDYGENLKLFFEQFNTFKKLLSEIKLEADLSV